MKKKSSAKLSRAQKVRQTRARLRAAGLPVPNDPPARSAEDREMIRSLSAQIRLGNSQIQELEHQIQLHLAEKKDLLHHKEIERLAGKTKRKHPFTKKRIFIMDRQAKENIEKIDERIKTLDKIIERKRAEQRDIKDTNCSLARNRKTIIKKAPEGAGKMVE